MTDEAILSLPNGDLLSTADVREILGAYMRECPAVLDLYDGTNLGPHDELLPIDVLAVNALNAFGPRAMPMTPMTAVWVRRHAIESRVGPITRLEIERLSQAEIEGALPLVVDALVEIDDVRGFGSTATTKLLHRLRPNITPIWDTRVEKWYPEEAKQDWTPWLRRVLSDVVANRACLEAERDRLPYRLPLVRVWDIVLWQLPVPEKSATAD